jgi:hypothetical protein
MDGGEQEVEKYEMKTGDAAAMGGWCEINN